MLSNAPVTDCSACNLGVASQGRCRLTPTSRESGATICAQGERPRTVYFVKEGFVALSAVSPRGSELLLSLRGPSSLLCTEAMQNEPSPFEVRALSRVKILRDRAATRSRSGWGRTRAPPASCSTSCSPSRGSSATR